MRVISRKRLREFWERYPDAEQALKAWFHEVEQAVWHNSADIKASYRSASIVTGERVVFNICGNKYRLVIHINYAFQIAFIRFVGTHREYNKMDVRSI